METVTETTIPPTSKRSRWIMVAIILQIITLAALIFVYVSSQKPTIKIEKPNPIVTRDDTEITSLQNTIDDLNARLESLEQQPQQAPDTQKIESLERAIDTLEEQIAAQSDEQSALVQQLLAIDQLESAVMEGRPYATALKAFIASGAVFEEREALERHQHKGIATRTMLRDQFNAALTAYYKPKSADTQSLWQRVSSLITIRKVGEKHQGDDAQSIIARAESAMNNNKPDLALEELETLSEVDRTAFASWIKRAKARQNVLRTLDEIRSKLKAPHA